ncbi:FG-GAP-like repeat-containing protein [Streptomyces sp. NPDC048337]|uniref:FG-GAP-like repeat-containing protein n=1 Tax=Streptomyces sp. NPDC048337 TaxID=3365535 RepID=UPI003717E7DA
MRRLVSRFRKSTAFAAVALSSALAVPGSAHADTVTPAAAPPLRFISYNICGNVCGAPPYDNQRRVDSIVAQAGVTSWNADQIFLQEVCRPQYDSLAAELRTRGFRGLFSRTVLGRPGICGNADYGNAVIVRGQITQTLDLDLTVGGEKEPIRVPCVQSTLQYRPTWSCSVHLYWDNGTLAVPEAERLAARARTWEEAGTPVVLGGDFNHSPRSSTLSRFYDTSINDGAFGRFIESDETDAQFFDPAACTPGITLRCRSGEATVDGKKLDYVFLGTRDFSTPKADLLPLDMRVSDHRMLRAAAAWSDCGPLDPARGAAFRREASGALFRQAGQDNGTLAAPCKAGEGWSRMRQVVRLPGTADLAAVDTDGTLWRYGQDGQGRYSDALRVRAATGWQRYDKLVAPGDVTGDGRHDLITRDTFGVLWLHRGTGDGAYAAPVRIGSGWGVYDALLSPGDFSGDGLPDLLARDGAGNLYLHRGTGAGGFAPRTRIGTGWGIYTALVPPGDLNRDARADLLGRDGAGNLYLYRGTGTGSYLPRVRVGTGYPAGELMF